jgi:hypothetical protein
VSHRSILAAAKGAEIRDGLESYGENSAGWTGGARIANRRMRTYVENRK